MDREKTPHRRFRLGTRLLALSRSGVRRDTISPVVFVLPGSIGSRQAEFPKGARTVSQLVVDPLQPLSPSSLQKLPEEAHCCARVPVARDGNIQDIAVLVRRLRASSVPRRS